MCFVSSERWIQGEKYPNNKHPPYSEEVTIQDPTPLMWWFPVAAIEQKGRENHAIHPARPQSHPRTLDSDGDGHIPSHQQLCADGAEIEAAHCDNNKTNIITMYICM